MHTIMHMPFGHSFGLPDEHKNLIAYRQMPPSEKAAVIQTMLLRRVNVVKKRFRYVENAMSCSIVHFITKLLSMFACLLSLESRVTKVNR